MGDRFTGPANQGFLDLATPQGYAAIVAGLLLVGGFIMAGAAFGRAVEKAERARRQQHRAEIESEKNARE